MKPGYKKPTLKELLTRRGVSLKSWMKEKEVSSKEKMLSVCSEMGVEPPGADELSELFPKSEKPADPIVVTPVQVESPAEDLGTTVIENDSAKKLKKKKNDQV